MRATWGAVSGTRTSGAPGPAHENSRARRHFRIVGVAFEHVGSIAHHLTKCADTRRQGFRGAANPQDQRRWRLDVERLELELSRRTASIAASAAARSVSSGLDGGAWPRAWKHFEGDFSQHAESPAAADHRLMEQQAGRILHDLAAGRNQLAAAIDDPRADEEVANAAVAEPARAAGAGRRRRRRSSRLCR